MGLVEAPSQHHMAPWGSGREKGVCQSKVHTITEFHHVQAHTHGWGHAAPRNQSGGEAVARNDVEWNQNGTWALGRRAGAGLVLGVGRMLRTL